MQAMKPITGIQVPNEKICAKLTPNADNSSIPVSVKYTCTCKTQVNRAHVAAYPQPCSCTNLLKVRLNAR